MHVYKGQNFFVHCWWELLVLLLLGFFVGPIYQIRGKLLNSTDGGMNPKIWLHVPTIQVIARHACPIVSNYDTIRIDHWNNLEHDALPQLLGLMAVTKEVLYESLHHVGAV